jgi:hypothetical protein
MLWAARAAQFCRSAKNMKTSILFVLTLVLLSATRAAEPTSAGSSNPLVGTWKLIACENRSEDGQIQQTFGANPKGILMYDAGGRMSVHLMGGNRTRFTSPDVHGGTASELKEAFDSYMSYFGTYEIDAAAGTVAHHLEGCSYPNWVGTTQQRFLKIEGKRLSLSTPPMRVDGKGVRVFLIWERFN